MKYHAFIWILKRTIKGKHPTVSLLTASLTQEGDLNTLRAEAGFDFQIWGGRMLQLKWGGKELVSQQPKSVRAHSGSLKGLHLVAAILFMYVKHLSHLEMERRSERPEPFNPVPFPTLFSSQDSVQHAWRLGMQDFLPVAFSSLFNTSQIHLFQLLSFGLV